jgi:uncharacterized membrane protein YgaE (UPF0421/DUF939 family)
MGKIYPILVSFSIFPLKCMVKNYFKNVFGNLKTIMKSNETVLDKCSLNIVLKEIA